MPSTEIEVYTTDGIRLAGQYYPVAAAPLAYVVCHGFTQSARAPGVQAIVRRLVGRGAAVAAVDFRGHGRSAGASTLGADEDRDVAAVVRFLRAQGHATVVSAGWSMGGSIVLRQAAGVRAEDAAAAGSDGPATATAAVDAVISVSGPGLWFERGTRSMRRVNLGVETAWGRRALARLRRTRVSAAGWGQVPPAPVEVVGRIAVPMLVVHGDHDPYFPLHHPRALAAAAPNAQLWIEPGMGHAESATTPELVDRIDAWARRAVPRLPEAEAGTAPI